MMSKVPPDNANTRVGYMDECANMLPDFGSNVSGHDDGLQLSQFYLSVISEGLKFPRMGNSLHAMAPETRLLTSKGAYNLVVERYIGHVHALKRRVGSSGLCFYGQRWCDVGVGSGAVPAHCHATYLNPSSLFGRAWFPISKCNEALCRLLVISVNVVYEGKCANGHKAYDKRGKARRTKSLQNPNGLDGYNICHGSSLSSFKCDSCPSGRYSNQAD